MNAYQQYLADHALTEEFAASRGITHRNGSIVVPVHTPKGKYAFDLMRRLGAGEVRYDFNPNHCRPSLLLYGFHHLQKDWPHHKYFTFVVEGFSDALALQSVGIPAVAIMAGSMSRTQRAIIDHFGIWPIVWGDDDESGREFVAKRKKGYGGAIVQGHDPASLIAAGKQSTVDKVFRWVLEGGQNYVELTEDGELVESVEVEDE